MAKAVKKTKKAPAKKPEPKKTARKKAAPRPAPQKMEFNKPLEGIRKPEAPAVVKPRRPPFLGLVFDTETDALIFNHVIRLEKQPNIIEFYGAIVDLANGGEIVDELDTLIKPPRPLSAKPENGSTKTTTQITGITNEMLETAPRFVDVAPRIRAIIEKAPRGYAHNASFDVEVVNVEFERLGATAVAWPHMFCTVEQTVCMKGFRLSLTALHTELFGEPFPEAHRARNDVKALTRCLCELYDREMI